MRKTQVTKRTLAVTLSALIATMLPLQVLATNLPEENAVYSSFDNVQGNDEKIPNIVTELITDRTENSKVFLLEDGSKMIAEYNQPVHYKDSDDVWVEYNNSLISENSSATIDEADIDYSNKSSNIDIKLKI